ncbi:sulfotransferase [Sphingopyxis sp.]|uniref:tetratricopeptide repeat-containing sulfotransferase family protein n=1 Tax=Sphingopyxis sp. TaxID=1908224 RepID=UPI003D0A99F4
MDRISTEATDLRVQAAVLRAAGERKAAADLDTQAVAAEAQEPAVMKASQLLMTGQLARAEAIVRPLLQRAPENVAGLCILGEIAVRLGIYAEAQRLFRAAIAISPDFSDAKTNLARALFRTSDFRDGLSHLDEVLALDPRNRHALSTKLATLGQIGAYEQSLKSHEQALMQQPDEPWLWVGYGNVCKTLGLYDESVSAFRGALSLDQRRTEAWWGLANLKRVSFDAADRQAMLDLVAALPDADPGQVQLHFALGKAYEDARDYTRSFDHYATANRIRRAELRYDAQAMTAEVSDSIAFFDADYFAAKTGIGDKNAKLIFIVGMPRAGSTLVEQILASHSQIEGTAELPYIPLITQKVVADRWSDQHAKYPQILTSLNAEDIKRLADHYTQSAAQHRQTGKPYMIDKLPNNWLNIGLIKTLFPNAKIIDARRAAMACCFANFKQHFARGQGFSYALAEMGQYYRDYVRFMDHIDQAAPGAAYRLVHEQLIEDPEREIRGLLAYLELPFEDACLNFHENKRPVRTPSAEQVRRPINRDAVDQWRNYQSWLQPLKDALGDLAES